MPTKDAIRIESFLVESILSFCQVKGINKYKVGSKITYYQNPHPETRSLRQSSIRMNEKYQNSVFNDVLSPSYLVVHPNFVEKAHQLFYRFGIRIVEGRRYLGGFIGSDEGKIRFTLKKVQEWLDCLGELSKVAEKEPQAALVGLTRSLQCEWNFVQRVS